MKHSHHLTSLVALAVIAAASVVPATEGVSPGAVDRLSVVETRCPTFSWGADLEAQAYQLIAYLLPEERAREVELTSEAEVLFARVAGSATSWTPSAEQCFAPGGRYVWFIRAVMQLAGDEVIEAGDWSAPRYFEVPAGPTPEELERALDVLKRWEAANGSGSPTPSTGTAAVPVTAAATATDSATGSGTGSGSSHRKSVPTASAAVRGEHPDTTGEAYGVVGTSASSDGAGVAAANLAGGADLVLDGSADGEPDARLWQGGVDRPSAADESFVFSNSGSGLFRLDVVGDISGHTADVEELKINGSTVIDDTGEWLGLGSTVPCAGCVASSDIADDSITSGDILDGTITGFDLEASSISTTHLNDYSVSAAKLATAAVTSVKIADAAVTAAKLAPGAVGSAVLGPNSVESSHVVDGSLGSADLADGAVTGPKLASGSVGSGNIRSNAVDGGHLVDGSVGSADLADGAVTGAKLADGSVGTSKIRSNAVTNAQMADDAVTGAEIADGAVTGFDIAAASISAAHLADGSVTTAKLADAAVTTAKLAIGSVTSASLADFSITGSDIGLNAVDSIHIADNAVSVSEILSGSVITSKLANDAVTTDKVLDGTLTAADINPTGGIYTSVSSIYSEAGARIIYAGETLEVSASCLDLNDLPLSGSCHLLGSGQMTLVEAYGRNWLDPAEPGEYVCTYRNGGTTVESIVAEVYCIAVPGS